MATRLYSLRFDTHCSPYNAGELAGFPAVETKRLLLLKAAHFENPADSTAYQAEISGAEKVDDRTPVGSRDAGEDGSPPPAKPKAVRKPRPRDKPKTNAKPSRRARGR